MKIAEYIDALPSDMVYCSAAINKEYMVQMADEHFYHFWGKQWASVWRIVSTRI